MPEIQITEPSLLIRISKLYHEQMTDEQLYEATRGVWRIGGDRDFAQFALSIANGIVKEVYQIGAWQPAGTANYKTRPQKEVSIAGRWEFTGTVAPASVRTKYVGKSAAHYFDKGNSNPINYVGIKI
jgi:hypothetical protein